jgi:hypothetical protein
MKPLAPISVDDSLWPLVIVRMVGTSSPAEFEAYLEKRLEFLRRGQPHLHLVEVDTSRNCPLPPEQRQRLVKWMAQHEEAIRQRLLGLAYATDSAQVRLTLSLIFHSKAPTYPYVVVPNLALGGAWAAGRLNEAGLHADAERVRGHFGLLRHPRHG